MIVPLKICIYYDSPINISNNIQDTINTLLDYDIVILGEGLADPSHQDYSSTSDIINSLLLSNVSVFGYVSLTRNFSTTEFVDDWNNLSVTGIFADEFGYEYGNTRDEQNTFLDYIHSKNMDCMIHSTLSIFDNTVSPSNTSGDPLNYLSSDWYVYMGFGVDNGEYNNPINTSNTLQNYSIKVCCIATSNGNFTQNLADYSYYICVLMDFEAWGWGEVNFSGSLDYRVRKDIIGDKFTSELNNNNGIYTRDTNVGISINTNDKNVKFKIKS